MAKSKIADQLRNEQRFAFLSLDPVERIRRMEKALHEVLAIRAAEEGVTEYEIYRRYLGRDKKRRREI